MEHLPSVFFWAWGFEIAPLRGGASGGFVAANQMD